MVGEQSRHLLDADNKPVKGSYGAITSQGPHGWTMGIANGNYGIQWHERIFNCSTLLYEINKAGFSNTGGTGHNTGANIPISSSHPGGAHLLLGDGSVQFGSQNTDLALLQKLSSCNDGDIASLP